MERDLTFYINQAKKLVRGDRVKQGMNKTFFFLLFFETAVLQHPLTSDSEQKVTNQQANYLVFLAPDVLHSTPIFSN